MLLQTLKGLGYATLELLLTPLQFGIPNSRLRYYLLAKMAPLAFKFPADGEPERDRVWRHIPGRGADWVDPRNGAPEGVENPVDDVGSYLDIDDAEELEGQRHQHAIPDKVLEKWGRLFDIVPPSARRTCCFTRGAWLYVNSVSIFFWIDSTRHTLAMYMRVLGYTQLVERAGSVLQENEALDVRTSFHRPRTLINRGPLIM